MSVSPSVYGQTVIDWTGNGSSDGYNSVLNWSGFNVPNTTSESAQFNLGGTFDVTLQSGTSINVSDIRVFAGDINLAATGSVLAVFNVDDDLTVAGGDFTLSKSGGLGPIVMSVGDRVDVHDGSQLRIEDGSRLNTSAVRLADTPSGDGTIVVDGIGSEFNQTGFGITNIGQDAIGTLVYQNQATGDFASVLQLGVFSGAGDRGILDITSGASFSVGTLQVATGGANAEGFVLVEGAGSNLDVTSSLSIGVDNEPAAIANVAVNNGGQLTIAGTTTIRESGGLSLGNDLTAATVNATGLITVSSGGVLGIGVGSVLTASSGLDNSAGGTLIFNEGTLAISGGIFSPSASGSLVVNSLGAGLQFDLELGAGVTSALAGMTVADDHEATLTIDAGADVTNSGNAIIGSQGGAIGTVTVEGTGSTWTNTGTAFVGGNGQGMVTISDGATMTSDQGSLASLSNGAIGIVAVNDPGSSWTMANDLLVGASGTGQLTIANSGIVASGSARIGDSTNSDGVVAVTGVGSEWNVTGELIVGNSGTGNLTVQSGGDVTSGTTKIGASSLGSGTASVEGVGSSWTIGGGLEIGSVDSPGAIDGDLKVTGNGSVDVNGSLIVRERGSLTLDGGSIATNTLDQSGGGQFDFFGGVLTIHNGFAVGDAAFPHNLAITPTQTINSPSATVTIRPGRSLTLAGGKLSVSNLDNDGVFLFTSGTLQLTEGALTGVSSLNIPTNGVLQARGVYDQQPVVAVGGSRIVATDDLTLGDATALNGFYANGEVQVFANTLTLEDANDAVLDSGAIVTLGDGIGDGNLLAANGLTIDFGANIAGRGTIDTPNDPALPLTNNGHITGTSLANPLVLAGYVKGVGTLDNVSITGTDAPGFSPAAVNRGSVTYNGTLEIEIGGLTAGGQFDQVNHLLGAGIADLGGVLDVSLINGFAPTAGDSFDILTASGSIDNAFATVNLPSLSSGLAWNVNQGANLLSLAVGLAGDYNSDGTVDAADYTVWRDNEGAVAGTLPNDADGGVIGAAQYSSWVANFGAVASLSTSVPEPSGLALLACVGTLLMQRRRRA